MSTPAGTIPTRRLGGLEVGAVGLGCMGMTGIYGPTVQREDAIATLHRAIDLGVTLFDTADIYGAGQNEPLVGEALRSRRHEVLICSKFGLNAKGRPHAVDGRPEVVRPFCEASLRRLGVDHIDLYYLHRPDPEIPIEDTVGAMASLVTAGLVRHVGLSETTAPDVYRAAKVHAITAVQSEWSLFSRDLEQETVPACRELGIGIVAFGPLSRGLLTGAVTSPAFSDNDFRKRLPRFSADNLGHNLDAVEVVREIAADHGATPAQVALAWVIGRGEDVIPIPGSERISHLEENLGALDLSLSDSDLDRLESLHATGERYATDMPWMDRETPPARVSDSPAP